MSQLTELPIYPAEFADISELLVAHFHQFVYWHLLYICQMLEQCHFEIIRGSTIITMCSSQGLGNQLVYQLDFFEFSRTDAHCLGGLRRESSITPENVRGCFRRSNRIDAIL